MTQSIKYQYCPKCGGALSLKHIHGRQRLRCQACSFILYENPIVGVAAILFKDKKILLGKRNTSYKGLWCIPCGYVEYDEDVHDAVVREFKEETGLEIVVDRVYTVKSNFHNPERHTVGIWFLAREIGGKLEAADDLDQVDYFDLDHIPPLAFPTDELVIKMLRKDIEGESAK
jgi:ADP-ribose pyrophosphatase YjhB (NUDIX family)